MSDWQPTHVFNHQPTLNELAEYHSALFQLMHRDCSIETLREIARKLTLLAGYYHIRADHMEREAITAQPPSGQLHLLNDDD